MEQLTHDHPSIHVPPQVFELAAASVAGGRAELAARLGVSLAAVGNWKLRGVVPIEHCAEIEAATGGRVTRRDLRPADWQRIWPELAANSDQKQPPALASQAARAMAGQGA